MTRFGVDADGHGSLRYTLLFIPSLFIAFVRGKLGLSDEKKNDESAEGDKA